MGSGASFYLVGVFSRLSRKPILETRFRGFKLCSHRSSPYLPTGKATSTPCYRHTRTSYILCQFWGLFQRNSARKFNFIQIASNIEPFVSYKKGLGQKSQTLFTL